MKRIGLAFFIAIAATVLVAQDVPSVIVKGKCSSDLPEFKQWLEGTPLREGGQYVACKDREQQIVTGYPKLKLKMSVHEVQGLLGKPDFAVSLYPARLSTSPPQAVAKCPSEAAYIFRKKNENLADTSDVAVYVFFTTDDKLY